MIVGPSAADIEFQDARPGFGNIDPPSRKRRPLVRRILELVAGINNNKIIAQYHFARQQKKC